MKPIRSNFTILIYKAIPLKLVLLEIWHCTVKNIEKCISRYFSRTDYWTGMFNKQIPHENTKFVSKKLFATKNQKNDFCDNRFQMLHIYDTWTGLNVESWFSFTSSVLLFDDEFVFVEWADRFVMGNDPGLFKDVILCIPLLGPIGKIIISNIASCSVT